MFRKVGMVAVVGALVAPLAVVPAGALEPADDAAADAVGAVEAVAPAAAVADDDGDGLTESVVVLPLESDGRELPVGQADDGEEHGHGAVAARSGTLALPGAPEMLIFEDVAAGTHLAVRSRNGGTWSDWVEVVASSDDAPDGAADPRPGVGPVWIGRDADHVEVALLEGTADDLHVVGLHVVSEPGAPQGVRATATSAALASTFIRPRSAWATEEMGWKCKSGPDEAKDLRAMIVHHTATNTEPYAAGDVPSIIRGFWRYHVQSRGWCDVAYAFFVDRYGGVWEGRQGGITKAIVGGHTYGFNSETTSVAQIGNFQETQTPWAMTAATRQLVGWKLGYHGIDPKASTTLTNRTGSTFRGVPNGGQVPVGTVAGHRDLGTTSCPGQHTYDTLPYLRAQSRVGVHLVAQHETFLRALPTPEQYRHYLSIADTRGHYAATVAMARSREYSGLIIDDLYQRVLGRPADEEGKQYWLDVLASGVRVEDVGVQFYGSREYYLKMGGPEPYVTALYDNLLHREPDQAGLDYWAGLLRDQRAEPPDVADGFYKSIESRMDRVARLYQTILGRGPDRSGQQHWAERLLTTDDVLLAVELSLSDEFYQRAISS